MSKEYQGYRFFILIYVLVIANFAVLITESTAYYLWFSSSLVLLSGFLIIGRSKCKAVLTYPFKYKFSRAAVFLIAFIITYPRHYQLFRHLDYTYVAIFQSINVLFFTAVFCIKRKSLQQSN
jgi:hypothetical protein